MAEAAVMEVVTAGCSHHEGACSNEEERPR